MFARLAARLAACLAAAALGAILAAPSPAAAERPGTPVRTHAATEFSAQSKTVHRKIRRPRITVTPGRHLLYRDCTAWLAVEHRPSGTVIVPRRQCWWVRG